MKKISTLFIMLVFQYNTIAYSESRFSPWVHGGEKVLAGDPLAKSIVMLETEAQYCSATIIAENLLLTAAHCAADNESFILIHFSGLDSGETRKALRSVRHKSYQDLGSSTRNDLALIYFDGGLPQGFSVMPLILEDQELKLGDPLQLAGYGEGGPLGVLSQIKLSLTEIQKSNNLIQVNQSSDHGICHGDSGSPALKWIAGQYYLVGVASYTQEFDCSGFSVYTMVSPYKNWISKALSEKISEN